MRRGSEDPRAKAMDRLSEAIDGFFSLSNQGQDSDGEQALVDQIDQVGGKDSDGGQALGVQIDKVINKLQEIINRNKLLPLDEQLNSDLDEKINKFRQLLTAFIENEGGRAEAGAGRDGGAGAGGALAGVGADGGGVGGAGADGGGVGVAGGGVGGAVADGGAGGGALAGAGAVGEDLESLIARVTAVLKRRRDEFRRMQEERHQLQVQANEVFNVVGGAKEVFDLVVAETEAVAQAAAEERVKAARAAEAALAQVRDESARATRAEAERDAARGAQAAAEAALAQVRDESARAADAAQARADQAAQDAAAQALAERDAAQATAAQARAEDERQTAQAAAELARAEAAQARAAQAAAEVALSDALSTTEGFAQATEAALARADHAQAAAQAAARDAVAARAAEAQAAAELARAEAAQAAAQARADALAAERDAAEKRAQIAEQQILEDRLNKLKENEYGDSDETKELKKQISNYLYGIRELRGAIQDDDEKIKKLLDELKKAEDGVIEGEDKNEVLKRHNKALEDYVDFLKSKDKDFILPSPPEPAPPAPASPDSVPPAPAPAGPLKLEVKPAPEPPKKPDKIIDEDEKKRNNLYLRLNFNETAIPESKKDGHSNLFLVITDEVGYGSRKIDDNRLYNSYTITNQASFFRALNNEVDFFSGNGVRICFMKSRTQIKVGECDITEQSFIDINDEIAKTRIFIDENGRKKIEDYRMLLEEEFEKFLREHKDKKCNESNKNNNLSKINSLNGLDDLNQLKTLMTTWGATATSSPVNVFDDDLNSNEAIEKKAKELADKTLANRFKSGIIGVEVEKTVGVAVAAGAGVAGAPAPAKEYEEEAFGFIKIVRSKKLDEPVRVFVGETAGPMTANIWDKDTQSYVQISLKTTQIGEGGNQKTVIDEADVQQIAQNGDIINPPTSKLKIDLFIEKTGDRSGLFPVPDAGSAPGQDHGSELQMLQKIEIRGGSKVEGGGGYYLTNGFAHQLPPPTCKDNFGEEVVGVSNNKNITLKQNIYKTHCFEFEKEEVPLEKQLFTKFLGKDVPLCAQGNKIAGVIYRHNGEMIKVDDKSDKSFFDKIAESAGSSGCLAKPENPTKITNLVSKSFSKTSSPKPAPNPSGPSAGPAQQSSRCFPF